MMTESYHDVNSSIESVVKYYSKLSESNSNVISEEIKSFFQDISSFIISEINNNTQSKIIELVKIYNKVDKESVNSYAKFAFVPIAKYIKSNLTTVNGCVGFGNSSFFCIKLLNCILINNKESMSIDLLKVYYQIYNLILAGCVSSSNRKIIKKTRHIIKGLNSRLSDILKENMEIIAELDPKPQLLPFVGIYYDVMYESKDMITIEHGLDYIKLCLNDKVTISLSIFQVLTNLFKIFVKSSVEFEENLVPIISRMILRAPEKALVNIHEILKIVSYLDLSKCGESLTKNLSTHLVSQNSDLRLQSADCILKLVQNMSDTDSIIKTTDLLFNMLSKTGSDKIIDFETRQNICSLISHIADDVQLVDYTSKSKVVDNTLKKNFELLEKENNDVTISIIIGSISNWCGLISDKVPSVLLDFIKQVVFKKLKTVNKKYFYQLLNDCCFKVQKLTSIAPIINDLKSVLHEFMKSNFTVLTLMDILPLVDLLLRYSIEVENMTDSADIVKNNSIFTILGFKGKAEQSKFLIESFVKSASSTTIKSLITISKNLLIHFYDTTFNLPEHYKMILLNLYYCCLHADYEIRSYALNTIKVLVRNQDGVKIADFYIGYLKSLDLTDSNALISKWFWVKPENWVNMYDLYDLDSLCSYTHKIVEFINCCMSFGYRKKSVDSSKLGIDGLEFPEFWNKKCRAKLVYNSLLAFNQNVLVHFNPNIWANYSSKLLDSIDDLIELHGEDIVNLLLSTDFDKTNGQCLLKCVCNNFPEEFMYKLLNKVIHELNSPVFLEVSLDQVGIMNTKEKYIYNKQLLDNLPKYLPKNTGNIKRENKNYSYKEQLAEIELRKEIEESKKKKGPTKKSANSKDDSSEPSIDTNNPIELVAGQLTKKQMEQITNELEREKAIRVEMKVLETKFNSLCAIIDMISLTHQDSISNVLHNLIDVMYNLLIKSEIGCIKIGLMWLNLGERLTLFTKLDVILILRVLLCDTYHYKTSIKPCWTNNPTFDEFQLKTQPFLEGNLEELCLGFINKYMSAINFTKSFLFSLPMLCTLCESIYVEAKDDFLGWTDLDLLDIAIKYMFHHINTYVESENSWQLLRGYDFTKAIVLCIMECEDLGLQTSLGDTMLKIVCILNASHVQLKDTMIFTNLIDSLITNNHMSRLTGLNCLNCVQEFLDNDSYNSDLTLYAWILSFDKFEKIKIASQKLMDKLNLHPQPDIAFKLLDFTVSKYDVIKEASVLALTDVLIQYPLLITDILNELFKRYIELAYRKPAQFDAVGRLITAQEEDRWFLRIGTSKTLLSISPLVKIDQHIYMVFEFLIQQSLGDINSDVRHIMLKAGCKIVQLVGSEHIDYFLRLFEQYLVSSTSNDVVKECVVIFLGELAAHLDVKDDRFTNIFGKLLVNLSSSSEDVQKSVSETLEPLVKRYQEPKQREICDDLLKVLLTSNDQVQSRGAAYGIAGVLKSIGITRLKTFQIQDKLLSGLEDKRNERKREVVLFTYEQISGKMGKLFEPYVPTFLKQLQDAFGDQSLNVRKAAERAVRRIMSNLTAPGVKIILNPLLEGLQANQWRTKAICAEMLGSMSHCAPKQLSNCLPTIVPKILSILADSHPSVVKAGQQALREIGSVIQNKEMQVIVPVVIEALCDPKTKTDDGLNILIQTKFIHKVDPASLAFMMSMVTRAFRRVSKSETKRKAAQIIANLHSLTEDKDLQPYCSDVLPGLKNCLTDADPYVRSIASIALGTVAKVMRTDVYGELLDWLMDTLKDDTNSVNRSGAAQGLSEVMSKKGFEHLEEIMPDIMAKSSDKNLLPHIRDGYLKLYIHLPRLFRDQFSSYIPKILSAILEALSDESEFVRETGLEAATGIIDIYSHIALETMLPNLETGLLDSNWRIRDSSIRLLGNLLFRLIGISGKGTTMGGGVDETFARSGDLKTIADSIGQEHLDTVLAKLYLSRMDSTLSVRQQAVHIWKLIVHNTVRTLRAILPQLMAVIMHCLSAHHESEYNSEAQAMASATLADIVKKVGERNVPDIFRNLVEKFHCCSPENRVGICDAIASILRACNKEEVPNYIEFVLPVFRQCICDRDQLVRVVAVRIFDSLHRAYGTTGGSQSRVLEMFLPDLVSQLCSPDNDNVEGSGSDDCVLLAMSTLVVEKPRLIVPALMSRLTSPVVHTRALSHLASEAGSVIGNHVLSVLPVLLESVASCVGTAKQQQEQKNCCQLFLAMPPQNQMTLAIIRELQNGMAPDKSVSSQVASLQILGNYMVGLSEASSSGGDGDDEEDDSEDDDDDGDDGDMSFRRNSVLLNYIPQIYRSVIRLFIKQDKAVLLAAFDCFTCVNKALGDKSIEYVKDIRDAILMVIREKCGGKMKLMESVQVNALCLEERGIVPLTDLYKDALLNGRVELKDVAAGGIDDCLSASSDEAISKAAVKIAGPIIRTMSDRHSFSTRAFIVSSLGKLVAKCAMKIKLFHTQIVAILMRCLHEPNTYLRYKSQVSLAQLIVVYPKPDALFRDLVEKEVSEANEFKPSGFEAVRMCVEAVKIGGLSDDSLYLALKTFTSNLADKEDQIRIISSAIVGCCLVKLQADVSEIKSQISKVVSLASSSNSSMLQKHAISLVMMIMCKVNSELIFSQESLQKLVYKGCEEACKNDKLFIAMTGLRGLGFVAKYALEKGDEKLIADVLGKINTLGWQNSAQSMEIKDLVLDICSFVVWSDTDPEYCNVLLYAKHLMQILVNGYRAKESVLKLKAERVILDLLRLSISRRKYIDNARDTDDNTSKQKSSFVLSSSGAVINDDCYKLVNGHLDNATKAIVTEIIGRLKKTLVSGGTIKEQYTFSVDLDITYNPVPVSADVF